MIVKFIGKKKQDWEDYLDECLFAYNTARQESSKFTPFELMFSRKAILPVDLQTQKKDAKGILEQWLPELQKNGKIL